MDSAKNSLDRILNAFEKLRDFEKKALGDNMTEAERVDFHEIILSKQKFEASMDDDFNTADAIAAVFEIVRVSNSTVNEESTLSYIKHILSVLSKLCDVLGIKTKRKEVILDEDIEKLILSRTKARKNKDFKRADEIRNELLEMGIVLEDTREGVKWKRV